MIKTLAFSVLLLCWFLALKTGAYAQEFDCIISNRSEFRKNTFLGEHGYRIVSYEGNYILQERSADGWIVWSGPYQHTIANYPNDDGFHVYTLIVGLGSSASSMAYASMISVHKRSGRVAIFFHYGTYGNATQYQRAEVLQGECKPL